MSFDTIRNYYERKVFQLLQERFSTTRTNPEYLADLACVALNHLPARYIRHEVDMAFYLGPQERAEIEERIIKAVDFAVAFINAQDEERKKA